MTFANIPVSIVLGGSWVVLSGVISRVTILIMTYNPQ